MTGRVGNRRLVGNDLIWLPVPVWRGTVGSPAISDSAQGQSAKRISSWELDASTAEAITTTCQLPPAWGAFSLDVYWANSGAEAGDVVWSPQHYQVGAGTDMGASETIGDNVVATAGLVSVCVVTTVLTGVAITANVLRIELLRNATNAADTLANDCGVIGCMVRRA